MAQSEVARIREQIAQEYEACKRIFDDFTPAARHAFITKREKNIETHFFSLTQHMEINEAMNVLMQVEKQVHQPVKHSD